MEDKLQQPTPINSPVQEPPVPKQKQSVSMNKWLLIGVGIILLLILTSGAYYLGGRGKISNTNSISYPTPITEATSKPTLNPSQSEWKVFTAKSNATFNYPESWTVKEEITPVDSSGYGPMEHVTVTSPSGASVVYNDYISGLGGGCDGSECPKYHVLKEENIQIKGYGSLIKGCMKRR